MNSKKVQEMNERLSKLRRELAESGLEGVFISQAENRRYLSGFDGDGFLLISPDNAVLATDSRYTEQAPEQAPEFEVIQIKGDLREWFPQMVSGLGIEKVGFESDGLSFSTHRRLIEASKGLPVQLIPTDGLVESLRAVKETGELELITRAAELADKAIEYITNTLRQGITEREAAWQTERFLRESGSESMPFEIIVASGPNSALPHARPTERVIARGEPIMIDLGARVEGYASDLTRTICLGSRDETFTRIYDIVLRAQLTAIRNTNAEMSGSEADNLARAVIEGEGYGSMFGHGLGHGVGLAIHEEPSLSQNSPTVLKNRMAFTIEPGIYIKGWGGVRIEDTVVLEGGKVRVITRARK
jgi:Xaa-Pro aminopeptidase